MTLVYDFESLEEKLTDLHEKINGRWYIQRWYEERENSIKEIVAESNLQGTPEIELLKNLNKELKKHYNYDFGIRSLSLGLITIPVGLALYNGDVLSGILSTLMQTPLLFSPYSYIKKKRIEKSIISKFSSFFGEDVYKEKFDSFKKLEKFICSATAYFLK